MRNTAPKNSPAGIANRKLAGLRRAFEAAMYAAYPPHRPRGTPERQRRASTPLASCIKIERRLFA